MDDVFAKLKSGEMRLHEIENEFPKTEAFEIRRQYVEQLIGSELGSLSKFSFDAEKVYGRNCENLIGGASLPVGIAGPIKVLGENAYGEYFVPIATTEGALVASVNRGSKLISEVGGATVISRYVGITRAPVFKLPSLSKSHEFVKWFEEHKIEVFEVAESTDRFLKIFDATTYINGKFVWIRFNFNTSDAMGMNMAVIATKAMSEWMESKFEGLETISISGNMCVDKKPAAINQILGRGRIVEAEITIPRNVVIEKFNTTPEKVVEVNKAKIWVGGQMSGSLGFNAHFANMIAGMFIATGQDPAQVVDASLGSTNMDVCDGDLYVNIRIPSLSIATVGGGTGLASQNACQKIILTNLSKTLEESKNPKNTSTINNTQKLAEIMGAAVLAGELSLHIAFANKGFVKAHTDLGRNGGK